MYALKSRSQQFCCCSHQAQPRLCSLCFSCSLSCCSHPGWTTLSSWPRWNCHLIYRVSPFSFDATHFRLQPSQAWILWSNTWEGWRTPSEKQCWEWIHLYRSFSRHWSQKWSHRWSSCQTLKKQTAKLRTEKDCTWILCSCYKWLAHTASSRMYRICKNSIGVHPGGDFWKCTHTWRLMHHLSWESHLRCWLWMPKHWCSSTVLSFSWGPYCWTKWSSTLNSGFCNLHRFCQN